MNIQGRNKKASRGTVHVWRDHPSPLNPGMMRSICGRAYAFAAAIIESSEECCPGCKKKAEAK